MKKGYEFESETDTEVIVKLIQHITNKCEGASFRQLVEATIQHLVSNLILHYNSLQFKFIIINDYSCLFAPFI